MKANLGTNPATTTELLESLKLTGTSTNPHAGVKQPLRPTYGKPNRHRFSRVHPSPDYQYPALVVTLKGEADESYLAVPTLLPLLGGVAAPKILRLAVDSCEVPRLIGQPILDPNGRSNTWHESLIAYIKKAEEKWVRIESNMHAGQYQTIDAQDDLGEPAWPKDSMGEIITTCFQGRIIDNEDHPLIRQLRGRI